MKNEVEALAPGLVDEAEAARRLGISRQTLTRLRKTGQIRYYRIARRVLYGPDHLEQFLASAGHEGGARAAALEVAGHENAGGAGQRVEGEADILELPSLDSPAPPLLPPARTGVQSAGYRAPAQGREVDVDSHLELDVRDYFRSVRNHFWLIAGCAGLATALTALYVALAPSIYEAQARVQVDLERDSQALESPSKSSSAVVNDPTYFSTQLQILTGPGLLRRVVKALDLEHNGSFLHPQPERAPAVGPAPPASSPAPAARGADLAEANRLAPYVEAIKGGLDVEPVKETRLKVAETRLIDIRFRHTDPQTAAKVANTIADSFVLSNLEKRNETGTTASEFLQKRIAELKLQIRTGEEQLVNYAKNNQILSLDASQNVVVERLAGLNQQLLQAENERVLAEAAYRAALAPDAAGALAEESAKQVAADESRLSELKQRRAQLLVEATEEWPEVKEVNKQIAVLEKHVADTRGRATEVVTTNLKTRYRQAQTREQALRAAFDKQRGQTLTQNEAAINYRILQQEIETNRALLNTLLQRAKENDVLLAGLQNNIRVVDYALAPRKPVSPRPLLGLLVALGLSIGVGVGLAIYVDRWDDSIRSSGEAEKILQLPALIVIPSMSGFAAGRLLPVPSTLQRWNSGNARPELLLDAEANSPLAEAYRHLRTSVLLSADGRGSKALLVTSSQPAEGKTTTAVNMALSFAQTGTNVLLIDADMRKPRVHSILGLENRRGLSDYLSGGMNEAELYLFIQAHHPSKLNVISAGAATPSPAELLSSARMRRLLPFLKKAFTYIIIDSPPILPFSDGVLISTAVDGVLFVVQGGKVSREIVRHSQSILESAGAKMIGVVLNNVNLRPQDSYPYQRWRYYQQSYYQPAADPGASAE